MRGELHIVSLVKDGESSLCDAKKAANGQGCSVVFSVFLDHPKGNQEKNALQNFTSLLSAPWSHRSSKTKKLLRKAGKNVRLNSNPNFV